MLIAASGMFGIFLFLTYYLQQTLGYSPVVTGFAPAARCLDRDLAAEHHLRWRRLRVRDRARGIGSGPGPPGPDRATGLTSPECYQVFI
jgi:hypothetical protein